MKPSVTIDAATPEQATALITQEARENAKPFDMRIYCRSSGTTTDIYWGCTFQMKALQ